MQILMLTNPGDLNSKKIFYPDVILHTPHYSTPLPSPLPSLPRSHHHLVPRKNLLQPADQLCSKLIGWDKWCQRALWAQRDLWSHCIVSVYILRSKQKKANFWHPEDTQRYFNRPLGVNKIVKEYPLASHNVINFSVCKASIRSLLDANIP